MLKIGDKIVLIQEYAGCHGFGVIVSFTKSENPRIRLVNSNIEKTNSMYGDTIKYNPTFENIDGTIYTSRYNKTKFKSYTISISRNIYYFYKKYEKVTYM